MGRNGRRCNRGDRGRSRLIALTVLAFAAVPLGGCDELEPMLGDVLDQNGGSEDASSDDGATESDQRAEDNGADDAGAGDEAGAVSETNGEDDASESAVDQIGTAIAAEGYPDAGDGSGDGEEGAVDARSLDAAAAQDDDGPRVGVDMLSMQELATAERLAFEGTQIGDELSAATDRDAVLSALSDEGATGDDAATRVASLADRPSYRVLYTQRAAGKELGPRAAEVAIYRYDIAQPVFTRVDLETGDVSAMDVPAGMPVPLVRGEIDEAALIALNDPEIMQRLESAGIDPDRVGANGLLTSTSEEGSACQQRCVRLFLTSLERPVPEFAVIVDLVTLSIVAIEDMPGRSLNP